MTLLHLRRMSFSDAALFSQWEKKGRPYPWAEIHFLETMNSNCQKTIVFEKEKQIVGFAVIQIVNGEAHLLNIMVDPENRRKGFGISMMIQFMEWARTQGVSSLTLDVDPNNEPASRLYQKLGFESLERKSGSYPRGEDAVIMKRKI